jgi:hypothetical protein
MSMTNSFPALRRALALFADLDWTVADRLLHRMAQEPGKGSAMRHELELAEQDPATDWSNLVSNDSYELTDGDDPEAKELVLSLLWDALHPNEPPRNTDVSKYRAYWVTTSDTGGALDYNLDAGADVNVRLEDVVNGQELATIRHIRRDSNALLIRYEPAGVYPLPSTLRKLVRAAVRELLMDTAAIQDVTVFEFEDISNKSKSKLPN